MKKLTRKNPNDIYSLWLDLSSKDKSKARKAALALKSQLSSKKSLSDFWPIIREERDLTVDEIKAKIESVIKKTSGARVNPIRKVVNRLSNPADDRTRLYEIARKFNKSHDEIIKIAKSLGIYVFSAATAVDDADAWLIEEYIRKNSPKKRNPQTSLGFFPFETTYSPNQIESLIIYADEINGLKEKGKFVAADKKLQKLENLCGKRLAEKVVAWRKYNKY